MDKSFIVNLGRDAAYVRNGERNVKITDSDAVVKGFFSSEFNDSSYGDTILINTTLYIDTSILSEYLKDADGTDYNNINTELVNINGVGYLKIYMTKVDI